MTIRLKCPECGAKLKVKDALGGKTRDCPACKKPVEIPVAGLAGAPPTSPDAKRHQPADAETEAEAAATPAEPSAADRMFEEDFAAAPTIEQKAAARRSAPAAAADDADAPLPFDSLFDDDDDQPAPQIILAGGEKPGESSIESASGSEEAAGDSHKPLTQTGERIFEPGELPTTLGKQNHYLICDHKDVVARWENDGRGWMIHLKDGFARAATVENQIPQFGNFILVEVAVQRGDDGLHLQAINVYQLRRQYALKKIAKGDDAVLETIIDYAQLNRRQYSHVKDLVKATFLPHMWGEMEALLGPPPK